MGRLRVTGTDADQLLDYLVASKATAQPPGKSFYTLLLNERGGIEDDLIVLKDGPNDYLLVVNAVNTSKDLEHIKKESRGLKVDVSDTTSESTMIAIQGPEAEKSLREVLPANLDELKRFRFASFSISSHRLTISRTGYTGEDGFEVIIHDSGVSNPQFSSSIWRRLAERSTPCGLGARDSLRLEAGIPLYGQDIDSETNPFEADLSRVVAFDKHDFVGMSALNLQRNEPLKRIRRGLLLAEKIPRPGFEILNKAGEQVGTVTSGTFSPILKQGIALGYLTTENSEPGTNLEVQVRDARAQALVTRPPFYDENLYGWKRVR